MKRVVLLLVIAAALGYAHATAQEPLPPNSPSDVRVVGDGAVGWRIEWRDLSADETHFDLGMWLEDNDTASLGDTYTVPLGTVPANTTSLNVPHPLPAKIPSGCYVAHVLVFSVRGTLAWGLPGNVTTAICVDEAGITFPDAGAGPTPAPGLHFASLLASALGCALVAAGVVCRVRRPRPPAKPSASPR